MPRPTAVIAIGPIRIIVATECGSAHDPGFYDLHGIDSAHAALLCVKAKNHFRAAFNAICAVMIGIDAPGPAALDIARFNFRRAPRTLRPLAGWEGEGKGVGRPGSPAPGEALRLALPPKPDAGCPA